MNLLATVIDTATEKKFFFFFCSCSNVVRAGSHLIWFLCLDQFAHLDFVMLAFVKCGMLQNIVSLFFFFFFFKDYVYNKRCAQNWTNSVERFSNIK